MNDARPPAGAPGRRKPRGRGHERHEEILQAAARLFLELGVDNVSTRRIASAVGISQTTLYVYFPTKDAILEALCSACFGKLSQRFQADLARPGSWTDRLRGIMRSYVVFGLEHPDEYRLSFMTHNARHADKHFDFDAPLEEQEIGAQSFLMLLRAVREFMTEQGITKDPYVATQCIWASGHGLVSLLITMPSFPWSQREQLIGNATAMLLDGLAGRALPVNAQLFIDN